MAGASSSDLAEIRSGKGSARDRAEAGRGRNRKRRKKRSTVPKRFKTRMIKGR